MPRYDFRCVSCQTTIELSMPIKDAGNPQLCAVCKNPMERLISEGLGMVLKGDGWPGKAMKVNTQMTRKNRRLNAKQAEKLRDAPAMKLVPNVGGEEVGSWSEAKSLAASQGKDTTSYDPVIQKEKV